jgi:DNA helicase-2/ATP-dependent DNA helicase PcrA
MGKLHILGLDALTTVHERRAATYIAEILSGVVPTDDAYLCFGLRIGAEIDCVLLTSTKQLIGEMKEWPYAAFGYENGSWERMIEGARLEVMPGDQNAFLQAQRQRSLLAKRLARHADTCTQSAEAYKVRDWSRTIRAGLVQCPALNLQFDLPLDEFPWWFADGLREFVDRARKLLLQPSTSSLAAFHASFLSSIGMIRPASPGTARVKVADLPVNETGIRHIIKSGPGGGKTQRIAELIASLVASGGDAAKIFAISYTNRARDVLNARTKSEMEKLGIGDQCPQFGTIHQFARRLCGITQQTDPWVVLSEGEASDYFKVIAKQRNLDPGNFNHVVSEVLRSNGHNVSWSDEQLREAWEEFQSRLTGRHRQTFATMLLDALEAVETTVLEFELVIVDEFQDTNGLQFELLRRLGQRGVNIIVVGDDEQSIYSWAGAINKPFDRFNESFPGATFENMTKNYRSGAQIVEFAGRLRKDGFTQKVARDTEGLLSLKAVSSLKFSADAIADFVEQRTSDSCDLPLAFGDIAVLARTHAELSYVEKALKRCQIPCTNGSEPQFEDRWRMRMLLHGIEVCDPQADFETFIEAMKCIGSTRAKEAAIQLEFSANGPLPPLKHIRGLIQSLPDPARSVAMEFFNRVKSIVDKNLSLGDLIIEVWSVLLPPVGFLDVIKVDAAKESLRQLATLARIRGGKPGELVRAVLEYEGIVVLPPKDAVRLVTVHQAKGDEWPVVMLMNVSKDAFPLPNTTNFDEEQRLLHVATSRARDELHMFYVEYSGVSEPIARAWGSRPIL